MKGCEIMSKHFYENLKNVREKKGISQKEMAERIGVAKSTYSMYESGSREPNIQTIRKIADVLDVSIEYLMNGYVDYELQDKIIKLFSGYGTIAAHFDGEEYTEEELEEIKQFAEFVKSKRKEPNYWEKLGKSVKIADSNKDKKEKASAEED